VTTTHQYTTKESVKLRCSVLEGRLMEIWTEVLNLNTERSVMEQSLEEHKRTSERLWDALEAISLAKTHIIYAGFPEVKKEVIRRENKCYGK